MTSVMSGVAGDFAAALRDPLVTPPAMLSAHAAPAASTRFCVYRNNVAVSLIGALEARFPATRRLVGDEFFRAMARLYIKAQPPRSPLMMRYGDELPGFIARFEPAAEIVYLADIARLEAARTRAYHAADAEPLELSSLAALDPENFARLRLAPHPSLEIVESAFPIVTIWASCTGEAPLTAVEDWRCETALVARPRLEVEVRRAPPGAAAFLEALARGMSFGEAADSAAARAKDFDLALIIASLIGGGLLVPADGVKQMETIHGYLA
ncbi:HvfC/BufC N-terminal domain-containing protein [Methylocella silvestris]|uniref:DUF2063 domain-containing protein n=1 Tax=Methylocella silvestris TaxID=199596 RepID=A0A2J7TJG9_METSI|nr:DNA-binding domain-containing protein [Methylocella silvestris]PNG26911.1 DUF2063 domain-containing protein [Methylocella silvestris]